MGAERDILVGMDESDLREIRQARAEKEAADEVARVKHVAFNALVRRIYAARKRGDVQLLAEAAGLSTAQVKRLAVGQTSGNRKRRPESGA